MASWNWMEPTRSGGPDDFVVDTGPHGNGYSARIAITGSTRVARHAGTKLARSPITKRVVVTSA